MNFQEAFLILFWPVWERMMGLFVASGVVVGMYHVLVHSHSFRRPSGRSTFAGQDYDEEGGD